MNTSTKTRLARAVRWCGEAGVFLGVAAESWLFAVERGRSDDIAGGVFMGLLLIAASGIASLFAKRWERSLRN